MARVIVVETLDGAGAVRSRARLTSFPATLGRAYASDLIIDDPYVCAQHVEVSEDESGSLVAVDVSTVNGVWSDGTRVARQPIGPGTELLIGRTRLRFRSADELVAPALVDVASTTDAQHTAPHTQLQPSLPAFVRFRNPRAVAIGIVVGALALQAASVYLGSTERNGASSAISAALAFGAACAVWAGCWALATRIVSHRFNFPVHLVLALAAMGLLTLIGVAGNWLDFLVPAAPLGATVNAVGAAAVAGALFYGHLTALGSVSHRARLRAVAGAAALVVVAVGLTALASDSNDESTGELDYKSQLRPAAGPIVRTVSPEEFAGLAGSLRKTVDSLAMNDEASGESGSGSGRAVRPGAPPPRPPPASPMESNQ